MRNIIFWAMAAIISLVVVGRIARTVKSMRQAGRVERDAESVNLQMQLLAETPGHEDHMESVHDAMDELLDASDMDTLEAGLRQMLQISKHAHAIAAGANHE